MTRGSTQAFSAVSGQSWSPAPSAATRTSSSVWPVTRTFIVTAPRISSRRELTARQLK